MYSKWIYKIHSLRLHFLFKSDLFLEQDWGKCHSEQNLHVVQTASKSVVGHLAETTAELSSDGSVK